MRSLNINRVQLDSLQILKSNPDERPFDLLDFASLFNKLPKPEYGDKAQIDAIVRKALEERGLNKSSRSES